MKFRLSLLILLSITASVLHAQDQPVNPDLLKRPWNAHWISGKGVLQREYGIYHFRKTFTLAQKPSRFVINVSADNRYRLFVNGQPVCNGPARGDLYNWYFETVDIARYLKPGSNIIAAQVWNMGTYAPVAQISNQTALVVQGNTDAERIVNTDASWKVLINNAYKPCSTDNAERMKTYMVVGPGDEVDASKYPWNWEKPGYDDKHWTPCINIAEAVTTGNGTDNQWTLVPRTIPFMEESMQRMVSVKRSSGIKVNSGFLTGKIPLTIAPNQKVSILIDQTQNTVAYPEMLVSKGNGASIKITYAEALFKEGVKGNRNDITGKSIIGNYDIFKPDGGYNKLFRPLWLKTYRYIQLDIVTKNQPLIIQDFYGMYTGYPFKEIATFSSNDASLKQIWDVGWHTARLCAGENYYDCPYYEQLQYEGDTRIQSLVSLYVTGDDRLMRKALTDFNNSRVPEGLTQGRYPSNRLQVIPPFSLYWVSMIYDYWLHRDDEPFVKQFLTGMQGVLTWYEQKIDPQKNMLGPMPWWNFTDWNTAFNFGVPDGATDGNSSIITLQYAYTLRQAAEVFRHFNKTAEADHYNNLANRLCINTYRLCFDQTKMEMANTPDKNKYSQHAGIMGVLTGAVPENEMQQVMQNVLTDTTLSQATFYYRFYLTQALKRAGMGNMYYAQLEPWRQMLNNGLTTFAENPDPTRSDCHAWSASPNYDLLATVCGITPASAGFKTVTIKPHMGELTRVSGTIPHPKGEIAVVLQKQGKQGVVAEITLPPNITGVFTWNNKETKLEGGIKQKFTVN
jgi:alpha-L-rhamnosidase